MRRVPQVASDTLAALLDPSDAMAGPPEADLCPRSFDGSVTLAIFPHLLFDHFTLNIQLTQQHLNILTPANDPNRYFSRIPSTALLHS